MARSARSASHGPRRKPRTLDLFGGELSAVCRYKLLLHSFLQRRGSGIRQAIAERIGTNRSFVSQMTSPAYEVAVPARHVPTIAEVAGFTPTEWRAFVGLYVEAHPDRASEVLVDSRGRATRELVLTIPVLASREAQQRLEALIRSMAKELAATMAEIEAEIETGIEARRGLEAA